MSYNILGFLYSGRLSSSDASGWNHIPFEKLTHLVWAFMTPFKDGSIQFLRPDFDLAILKEIVPAAHKKGCKTLIAIGGWTNSYAFSEICASPVARAYFVKQCLSTLKQTGADGIDLDWEFPGLAEFEGQVSDQQNLILLLQELRAEFGSKYIITIDLPGIEKWYQYFDISKIVPLVDFISIMSYDLGSPETRALEQLSWHNSPLYSPSHTSPKDPNFTPALNPSFHQLAIHFLMQGCPPHKLNLGLGFYGRYYPDCLGLNQSWNKEHAKVDTALLYSEIMELKNSGKLNEDWCSLAQVPMGTYIDPKTGLQNWVSYDDERSIGIKVNYIRQEDFGGVLIWELGCDLVDGEHPLVNACARILKPN